MDVNDIPKAWRSALASIQTLYPDAVIAGGCLRDREHGVKVKDIDIFIPCKSTDSHEGKVVEDKMKKDGWQDVRCLHDESYNGSRISRSIETVFPNCPQINVIVMPYQLVEFDFGICQIEFNGKRIYRTPDYVLDAEAKLFRLIPKVDDNEFVRTIGRWARLKEKYPEWKLHLGSRAETHPFVAPPKTVRHVQHGPNLQQVSRRGLFAPPTAPLDYLLRTRSEEFVIPKALAERMSRELPRSVVKPHHSMPDKFQLTVHPDEIPAAARMIQDTVGRMWDQHRDAALYNMGTVGRP